MTISTELTTQELPEGSPTMQMLLPLIVTLFVF